MTSRSINDDASQAYIYYTKTPISTPSGTKSITENGTGIDVAAYAYADVNVTNNLGTKSITANGTYNASGDNLDGYSQVTVNVPSSATGTINITENANGIDVSSYEYANVNVPSPSFIKNPIEFDYGVGYVDTKGVWKYEADSGNNKSDIYTIENGKTYRLCYGATVSNRARGCLTETDIRTLSSGQVDGTFIGNGSTVTPGAWYSFTAAFDGYLVFQKSNDGTDDILTYLYCVDDMTDAEPSGTKSITANGQGIDVAGYSAVNVNVPGTTPPSGTITITQNGTGIDVAQYAYADVIVSGGGGQLPSDTTVTAIQISENSHDIVIPYDSQRIPMIVLGEPTVLSGTRYECSSFLLKRNFITGDFNQVVATYFNNNVSDDGLFIGNNAGTVVLNETNHTITMTVKSTSYWFYANDVFNVFIIYADAS